MLKHLAFVFINIVLISSEFYEPDCTSEVSFGECEEFTDRYFFDGMDGICKKFTYSGCNGNRNNYQTQMECNDTCISKKYDCESVPDAGNGPDEMDRFYHDAEYKQCIMFKYSGEGGNRNNYISKEDCQVKCMKHSKEFEPECRSNPDVGNDNDYVTRYYYDLGEEKCKEFEYGGSGGNGNNYKTLEKCKVTCGIDCTSPADIGFGYAAFPRYHYNSTSQICEEFIYGGTGGNGNNYETLEKCEVTCGIDCTSPADIGFGYAAFPRYHYNSTSGICEEFIYGGTGGNGNNYVTLEKCKGACEIDCMSPADIGFGYAAFPRYHYNSTSEICEEFIYGGTGGNGNNYETLEKCEVTCGIDCTSPADIGLGYAAFPRYHYNSNSGICEKLIYGGIDGNRNNYETLEKCNAMCSSELR